MIIDGLFSGVQVQEVVPVYIYKDGQKTQEQEKDSTGVPIWHIVTAMKSGAFVLPFRVKIAHRNPVQVGSVVKFFGVEAYAWKQGAIAWSAQGVEEVGDELVEIFRGEESE